MKFNNLKKYIKQAFKGKISITYGTIIALILGAGILGMSQEAQALTTTNILSITTGRTVSGTGNKDINKGMIHDTPTYGMKANNGAKAINKGAISDTTYNGMVANDGSKVVNNGAIMDAGTNGMRSNSGSAAINNGLIDGAGTNGMFTDNGVAYNAGVITNSGKHKMKAVNGGFAINTATLKTDGIGETVMKGEDDGTVIINSKIINVKDDDGIGMSVADGAAAINMGTIKLNAENGIGMLADGTDSTITNMGKIYLSGEKAGSNTKSEKGHDDKGNVGMKIKNNAKILNKGNIVYEN